MPDPATGQASPVGPEQVAERAEVDVEVVVGEPEELLELLELVHALLEAHKRLAEALALLLGEAAGVDAAHRLALHEQAKKLDHSEHQMGQPALEVSRVRVQSHGRCSGTKL